MMLSFDIDGALAKIQVKHAWFDEAKSNYVVDNRRTKTNRRVMKRSSYSGSDFDFAILVLSDINVFYIMPVEVFISYGSEIHLVEAAKRQRKPKSQEYREAWSMISQWAAQIERSE